MYIPLIHLLSPCQLWNSYFKKKKRECPKEMPYNVKKDETSLYANFFQVVRLLKLWGLENYQDGRT